MGFHTMKIANCRAASIRKSPWIPDHADDVIEIKKRGEEIEVDQTDICYDWKDRRYFRTRHPKGWICEGVVERGDVRKHGHGNSD